MMLPATSVALLSFLTFVLADVPIGCMHNNCLRAMIREGGVTATPFCWSLTASIVTNTAALPTYASMCNPDKIYSISSACSCYVSAEPVTTLTTSITLSTSTTTATSSSGSSASMISASASVARFDCHEDNCLRAMIREGNTGATSFCQQFTTAVVTDAAALPTYASMCTPDKLSGISSACSCFVTATPTPVKRRVPGCNEDNCLRAMIREGNVGATPFCRKFTTAVVTDKAALPTYASLCSTDPVSVSSACSCYVSPAPKICNEDNCLRAMLREGGVAAIPFCSHFTMAAVTDPVALPTYASMCTPNAISGISSACSCLY